jgi:hypothetical protein
MKRSPKVSVALLSVLSLALSSSTASSGTFKMQSTWYEVQSPSKGWTTVMVGATARYDGEPDLNDDKWIINSRLFFGQTHKDGYGYSGSGVYQGKTITATPRQYGASETLPNCAPTGGATRYRGRGQAAIYHQFKPEFSEELFASNAATDCAEPDTDGGGEGTNENPPGSGSQDGSSPIVIDLDRGGFRFTELENGVAFDIAPGGPVERVSWTAPGSRDGFLVLDRNFDGVIESGGELFGNYTVQPESDSPNGYAALAVYDDPDYGGDGDGRITVGDSIFYGLRVWVDADHDGYSDADELHPLAVLGIEAIGLDAVESNRRDRHGNELRYTGLVRLTRGTTHSADVFLLTE